MLALLVYLALSVVWYRSVVAHIGTNCACGLSRYPGDPAEYVWWLQWFVQSLQHGGALMHPTVIWASTGLNMFGTSASLLLAALLAPTTLLWGPVISYNVMMMLAPALSAWAANRLCRHITGAAWPSLLAGALFGFSTYEVAQLVGHPHMAVMVGPPLAALCVIRLLDGTLSSRRFVVQLSLLLTAQMLLSVEVMFTMTVVGVLALVAHWLTATPGQRRELKRRLGLILVPWVIAALVSSWFLVGVLTAPPSSPGATYWFPTDALSFIVPRPYTWVGGSAFASVNRHLISDLTENSAYLGLPLLLILLRYLVTRRHTRAAQLIGILMILLAFWILGPELYVAGKAVTPFPFKLVAGLPLLAQSIPGRASAFLALVAAIAVAIWLAQPRRHMLAAWMCAGIALICVLPNLARPSDNNVGTWTNPSFFSTTTYQHYLRPGETILPIKWGRLGESLMWQAEDHMYWKMANGYWLFGPPASWSNRVGMDLWMNHPRPGDGPLLRDMIIKRHVSDVVVENDSVARWQQTIRAAGLRPTARVGGITIYHVPATWSDTRPG